MNYSNSLAVNLICALTAEQTVLVIMIPVLLVIGGGLLVILLLAKKFRGANGSATFVPERRAPAKRKPVAKAPQASALSSRIDADEPPAERRSSVPTPVDTPEVASDTPTDRAETGAVTDAPPQPTAESKPLKVRYNRSFTARLILAPEQLKDYYAELNNKLISYARVKNRTGWALSSYNAGRTKLAKMNVKGKTLYLYTALEPAAFEQTKYKVFDVSDKKRYADVPTMFKIRSERTKARALELIGVLALKHGLTEAKRKTAEPISAKDFPTQSEKRLIDRGLIKVKVTGGQTAVTPEPTALKSVSVVQAQKLMTNEAAATFVKAEKVSHACGRKYPVNIDTLSHCFADGDTVDLAALKTKRIVPKNETAIKILARGTLDKRLFVHANDFSADAVKMIVLTGGQALLL